MHNFWEADGNWPLRINFSFLKMKPSTNQFGHLVRTPAYNWFLIIFLRNYVSFFDHHLASMIRKRAENIIKEVGES